MTLEERLDQWASQSPHLIVTDAERTFIEDLRRAAANGVGYGQMQQLIEWEWQHKHPGAAWGPEYFEKRLAQRTP